MPTVPSSMQPISGGGGIITTVWHRFFNSLVSASGPIASVNPTGSPFTYTSSDRGFLTITGGTVSAVSFRRASITLTFGSPELIPMTNGDVVTITYSSAPTIYFVPS